MENQLRCKINIGQRKRRMGAQKADMGELGEKTITDFLRVPARDWWKKVTKTLQKMKSKYKNRNIQSFASGFLKTPVGKMPKYAAVSKDIQNWVQKKLKKK